MAWAPHELPDTNTPEPQTSDPAHLASWLQEIHFMDVLSHLVMARKCGGGGDFGGSCCDAMRNPMSRSPAIWM